MSLDFFDLGKPGGAVSSDDGSPTGVIVVILTLSIAVGLGIAIVSAAFSGMGTSGVSYDERFSVSDPSVDQTVTLSDSPDLYTLSVSQFNGFAWVSVSSSYVSVSGTSVTVDSDGLQG